ncbi:MAG TPA: MFS transporter [Candidatus Methylomirabilis sp.]|nr:MFS transporter [Candidatus Methylomirabilis sp.]
MERTAGRGTIVRFCAATLLFWGSLYVYVPTLAPYAQVLGASLSVIGLILAAYGFTQFALRIPLGLWADRHGRCRPFILAGFLLALASGLGLGFAPGAGALLFFRGLAGVGAASWVAFTVLFAGYFPPAGAGRAMGIAVGASGVGQILSTALGGVVAEHWGWAAPFYAGALLAGAGAVVAFGLPESPRPPSRAPSLREALAPLGRRSLLLAAGLGALAQFAAHVTVYGFTPIYALGLGASKADLGLLTMVSLLTYTAATLFTGVLLEPRLGSRALVTTGLLVGALTTVIIPAVTDFPLLVLSQAVGGLGRGAVFPVLMALSLRDAGAGERATAMGAFQALYAVGIAGGPAAAGLLAEAFGLGGAFVGTGLLMAVGASLAWWGIGAPWRREAAVGPEVVGQRP